MQNNMFNPFINIHSNEGDRFFVLLNLYRLRKKPFLINISVWFILFGSLSHHNSMKKKLITRFNLLFSHPDYLDFYLFFGQNSPSLKYQMLYDIGCKRGCRNFKFVRSNQLLTFLFNCKSRIVSVQFVTFRWKEKICLQIKFKLYDES